MRAGDHTLREYHHVDTGAPQRGYRGEADGKGQRHAQHEHQGKAQRQDEQCGIHAMTFGGTGGPIRRATPCRMKSAPQTGTLR